MNFIEAIGNLSTEIEKQKDLIQTQDATKTACVIPFINLLGYNVSNLREVVPEYTADFRRKKGEKVDYAILKDGEVIMVIECKPFGTDLTESHVSQLYRYFSVLPSRIAVLTDGARYHFYSDLQADNKMDNKPFLKFNILDVQHHHQWANELQRFRKSVFNLSEILIAARDLKYTTEIEQLLMEQLIAPSKGFVRFFLSSVYSGKETPEVVEQFTAIVRRVLNDFFDSGGHCENKNPQTGEPYLRFWRGLRQYMTEKASTLNFPSLGTWRYIVFSIGRTGFSIEIHLLPTKKEISIRFCLDFDNAKAHFYLLQEQQAAIEKAFGEPLEWNELPEKNRSRISLTKGDTDPLDENDWMHQYEWFTTHLKRFDEVFRSRISALNAEDWRPEDS